MKPKISIIIPVYNAFPFMNECLKSLEKQTSQNFEAVFVDDCSKDNSYQELKKVLKNYSFSYQVLQNKKNEGPGPTRNNGVKHAKGEYITFLDADDYLDHNFIFKTEELINEKPANIYIFDYFSVSHQGIIEKDSLFPQEGFLDRDMAVALSNGMCWGKVYQKKIITKHKIIFPSLMRSEDLAFVKTFLGKCDTIYYSTNKFYYYVQNETSIMHTKKTMDVSNNKKAFQYIKENVENSSAIEMIFIREYLYLIVQIMILQNKGKKEIKKFISESETLYPNWANNPYLKYQPKYLRVLLFLIKHRLLLPVKLIFKIKK